MDQKSSVEAQFLELYDSCAEPIFRHCYFRVSSREVAEDLTQECFMRVWDYLASGSTIQNPKAFLYRVAGNLVVDHYRRKKETSLDVLTEEGYEPEGEGAHEVMQVAERTEALRLLEKLDGKHREILTLRYVDDLSIGDIAAVIGESENVVSVRIHRALEKLKHLFTYGT